MKMGQLKRSFKVERMWYQQGRNEVVEEMIREIKSFKIPENVETLPESQRICKEWQNLLVELIIKRIKGLKEKGA